MKFKVKLTYPTVVKIGDKEYTLFPGKEIGLPENHDRVRNLVGMGYIEPISSLSYKNRPINVVIDGVLSMVNAFLRTLIGRGVIVDGKCWFPKDKNPPDQLAAGRLHFAYSIMPPTPAERITFTQVVDINLLKKLAGGKTYVFRIEVYIHFLEATFAGM